MNEAFVAVWIDVRTAPLPRRTFVPDVLVNAKVDAGNKVIDPFSRGFFLRSVVLAPDGETLLNRAPTTLGATLAGVIRDGDNAYAKVDAGDYLSMLQHALSRQRGE